MEKRSFKNVFAFSKFVRKRMNRHRPFSLLTKILHQRVKREWKSVKREKEREAEKNLKQPVLIHFHLPRHFFFFIKVENPPSIHAYFFLFPSTKALLMRALTPRDPCWPFFFLFFTILLFFAHLPIPPSPSFFSPLFHPLPLSFFSSLLPLSRFDCVDYRGVGTP